MRYCIALLATVLNPFIEQAQKQFGPTAQGYLLSSASLPHITLAQLSLPSNNDIESIWQDIQKINIAVQPKFSGIGISRKAHNLWGVSLTVARNPDLMELHRVIINILRQHNIRCISPIEDLYKPHLTLARIPHPEIANFDDTLLEDAPFILTLGLADENGQYLQTIYPKNGKTNLKNIKVILIHGNGHSTPQDNWLPYVKHHLEALGIPVIAKQFPDIPLARAIYWLPFLKNELKADEHTIIVGHSSGAVAALRFAEQNKILGSVLIGAMHTDLGMENEILSGYYQEPWDWQKIKENQQWIIQFASTDDPWIPIDEPRFIHEKIDSEYYEYTDQGHFGGDYYKETFPELVQALKDKL